MSFRVPFSSCRKPHNSNINQFLPKPRKSLTTPPHKPTRIPPTQTLTPIPTSTLTLLRVQEIIIAYTRNNAREGLAMIRERLDRAIANPSWLNMFPNTQIDLNATASSSTVIELNATPYSSTMIDLNATPSLSTMVDQRAWAPPQKGYLKLNTDGSWMSNSDAGGGGVIRDYKGEWQIFFFYENQ